MKLKVLFLSMLATAIVGSAAAQVENDDMYFNASDRAKLREARKAEQVTIASNRSSRRTEDEGLNPTDSYSARNVNPEYTSRAQSETSEADEEEYFNSDYRYNNASQYNNWNNNFNNWYGSSWYRTNYWGPSIYGWRSPYYGSAYDAWGNPWANPYYRSGWSTSFSLSFGNAWNYGGWGGGYCDPYYGYAYDPYWGSYYSPYYGYGAYYGSPFRSRYSYYPTYVVVTDNNSRGAAYGKRASRSSQYNRETYGGSRGNYVDNGGRDRANSNGRSNSSGRQRTEYYNNTWRNNSNEGSISTSTPTRSTSTPTRSFNSGNTNSSNTRSSWESQQRSSYTPSTPTRSFDSSPSRSFNSGSSGSSGGRSSSGGGSGSRSSRGGN